MRIRRMLVGLAFIAAVVGGATASADDSARRVHTAVPALGGGTLCTDVFVEEHTITVCVPTP